MCMMTMVNILTQAQPGVCISPVATFVGKVLPEAELEAREHSSPDWPAMLSAAATFLQQHA